MKVFIGTLAILFAVDVFYLNGVTWDRTIANLVIATIAGCLQMALEE